MNDTYALYAILTMAAVTAAIRFAPFVLLGGRKTPEFVVYLGKVLPYAVMAMLVVYCLKDVEFAGGFPFAEAVSVIVVVILHAWKRNTLLSIVLGTICYMVMINC